MISTEAVKAQWDQILYEFVFQLSHFFFLVSKLHFLKFRSKNNQFSIKSISWNCQIIKSKWLMLLHDKSSSIVQCLLWTCSRLHINYLLFSTPSRWNFAAAAPQWVEIFSEVQVIFFQKHLILHQLTHNMTKIVHWITSSVHENSKLSFVQ